MIDGLLQDSELPAETGILLNSFCQAPDGLGDAESSIPPGAFGQFSVG
jgi:hypothetical protein